MKGIFINIINLKIYFICYNAVMGIKIIQFKDEYLNDIRAINVSVSSNPNKPDEKKVLSQHLYIDYYTEFSKENCFVAINCKNNEIVGYIISEVDFHRYKQHMITYYTPQAKAINKEFEQIIKEEVESYVPFINKYDAHLHMDVKPSYQHQGIGTMMLQYLFNHLKNIGCKGVMLSVSKSNERANNFYEKHGMKIIGENKSYIRGKIL
ncbi:MAG TPA: GNAT family N-acetyltransferase [Erysipelotrichaceae bacterium]|nr:GNAT family N-acetyltransferase [Erysipelotrichia bacterium]HPX32526.1 GNAT family N-acetyltransferase [Erysipelotrichaceae bacterium]HQA84627.1 GNAT family N-acetyltransferase [Erysipelotrichaceae bacterium]